MCKLWIIKINANKQIKFALLFNYIFMTYTKNNNYL